MPIPRFKSEDWRAALASGRIVFRVTQQSACIATGVLREPTQLDTRVVIDALDARADAHFGAEFLHFIAQGRRRASYPCRAFRTIEKFGEAIQYSAPYTLELAWLDKAEARQLLAIGEVPDWRHLTGARAVIRRWRRALCGRD
ncbi:hypothetical protein [Niveibacterium sp.]|uniref:hypothetical protein n=1 Tax=Niveibacterium sp. TaxID=2017444 RepID=UPI0035B4CF8C